MRKVTFYTFPATTPNGLVYYDRLRFFQDSFGSPVINGRRVLQANPWSNFKVECRSYVQSRSSDEAPWVYPEPRFTSSDEEIQNALARAASRARGSVTRKVRSDPASLGVSFASWRQSATMVRESGDRLARIFLASDTIWRAASAKSRRVQRLKSVLRQGRQPTAGLVLEGFFGWAPLYQDIVAALGVMADPFPPSWAASKQHQNGVLLHRRDDGPFQHTHVGQYRCTATFATEVEVSNPNIWIANKLGLLNPGAAAWDLIPWSFLVGAFVNVNQLIGACTDFAGLTLKNASSTSRVRLTQSSYSTYTSGVNRSSGSRSDNEVSRGRTVGTIPPYVPMFRVPDVNWDTAVIASALMVQNLTRLNATILGFKLT